MKTAFFVTFLLFAANAQALRTCDQAVLDPEFSALSPESKAKLCAKAFDQGPVTCYEQFDRGYSPLEKVEVCQNATNRFAFVARDCRQIALESLNRVAANQICLGAYTSRPGACAGYLYKEYQRVTNKKLTGKSASFDQLAVGICLRVDDDYGNVGYRRIIADFEPLYKGGKSLDLIIQIIREQRLGAK